MPEVSTKTQKAPRALQGAASEMIRYPRDKAQLDQLVECVGSLLREYKALPAIREHARRELREQLAALDREEAEEREALLKDAARAADKIQAYADNHQKHLTKTKTAHLPSGSALQWTEQHDQIIELIDDLFIAEAKRAQKLYLIRVEESPNRSAIRNHLDEAKRMNGIEFGTKYTFRIRPSHTDLRLERDSVTNEWRVAKPRKSVKAA